MDDLQSKDTQSPEVREQMLRALKEGKLNQNDGSISEEMPENVQGEAEVTPAVNKDKSDSEISAANDSVSETSDPDLADTKVEAGWTLTKGKSLQELGDTIIMPAVDRLKKSLEQEDPEMRKRRNRQRKKQEVAAKRIASTGALQNSANQSLRMPRIEVPAPVFRRSPHGRRLPYPIYRAE